MELMAAGFFHLEQNHVADQVKQPFLEFLVLHAGFQFCKVIFHLPLRGEFQFQEKVTAGVQNQEIAFHLFGGGAKNFPHNFVSDERFHIAVVVEGNSALAELSDLHRDGGNKKSQNAFNRVRRTAPDTEEAEDVINPKRIEVGAHLFEPLLPPGKTVLFHARPVVGRKAPVLTLRREGVRRRACLHVRMKKFRLLPDIRTVAIDTDGDVTLQNQALCMDVFGGFLKLKVKMELDEIIQLDFVADGGIFFNERGDFVCAIKTMSRPPAKVCRSEPVAQSAERRVRRKPMLILVKEILVVSQRKRFFLLLWKYFPDKLACITAS